MTDLIWESIKPSKEEIEWMEFYQQERIHPFIALGVSLDLLGSPSDTNHHQGESQEQVYRKMIQKERNTWLKNELPS